MNRLFFGNSEQVVQLTIDGEVITATPEHPFYVDNVGWIGAEFLNVGDKVKLSSQKTAIVECAEKVNLENPIAVYSFDVEDYHTYFVFEFRSFG